LRLTKRAKLIAEPYIAQYGRSPVLVKTATWILIALILLPDPFDWFPGIAFMDEVLYASVLLHLLHKYGALPDEEKKSAKDLVKEIFVKDKNESGRI
jgi:uncharacterized membrane protein YkvA (DUF1232 family)